MLKEGRQRRAQTGICEGGGGGRTVDGNVRRKLQRCAEEDDGRWSKGLGGGITRGMDWACEAIVSEGGQVLKSGLPASSLCLSRSY